MNTNSIDRLEVSLNFSTIISPIKCEKLNYLAVTFIFLLLFGIILNSLLLWSFFKCPKLQEPSDYFMITMTFFNLIGTAIIFPFMIVTNFKCK